MTLLEWLREVKRKIDNNERLNFAIAFGGKIEMMITHISELEAELDYLRFFHRNADFGPAHTDVVMAIQAKYEATGKQVPVTWKYE